MRTVMDHSVHSKSPKDARSPGTTWNPYIQVNECRTSVKKLTNLFSTPFLSYHLHIYDLLQGSEEQGKEGAIATQAGMPSLRPHVRGERKFDGLFAV